MRPLEKVRATRCGDDGFTLIEIILAMVLTIVVMTAMLGVLVSSLKTVAQARQRQTATALATQSLENLRALPYDAVTGVDAVDFPYSGSLEYQSAGKTAFPAALFPGAPAAALSETLLANKYSGKRVQQVIAGITYYVQTYVTKPALTAAGQQSFNLTSIVRWTSPVYPTTRTVAERSTTFSPAGCLSTAQSPFAAPCQAYFTAQAGVSAAGFTVTNAVDSTLDVPNLTGRLVELNLPTLSANLQVEQTASGSATAATSGARSLPGAAAGLGAKDATVSVDSDPSSTPAQVESVTALSQTSSPAVSITGTAGNLWASPTSGDNASSAAAIGADSTTCKDGSAIASALVTGPVGQLRSCASGLVRQSATAGKITFTSPTSVDVSVLSLAGTSETSRAVAANLAAANPGVACAAGAGAVPPGCAHSRVYRTLGDLIVGSAPTGAGSLDPNKGVLKVKDLKESAVAERGSGAGTPLYTRTGTLTVWTPDPITGVAGYTEIVLGNYSAPPVGAQPASQTWLIPAVTSSYSGGITVTVEGSVTVQRPQITVTGPPDCKAAACVTQVSGAGGLRALTTFTVTGGGADTQFVLVSEIGGLVAQSTFKAAANA